MRFLFLIIFFLILPVAFPARTTPDPDRVTVLTVDHGDYHYNSTTWHSFSRFIDLEKGSEATGVCDLKRYFHRFGYLPSSSPGNFTNFFDESLESAVFGYQRNLGLPVTGRLDSDTIRMIMAPRCGVVDSYTRAATSATKALHETRRFEYFYGRPRWVKPEPMTLTYALSDDHMIDYISRDEVRAVFARAFSRWSKVIPLNFTEAEDYRTADIKIGFHRGDHGDGEPFDGVLGILAHAFSPQNGRLHLDGAETWAVDFKSQRSSVAVDLESVATHEIGHVLGLAHSSVQDAIMYPSLSPRSKKVDLRVDDVEGVQALYGSNPNFKFSSLIESEETSSSGGVVGGGVFGSTGWSWVWVGCLGLAQLMFI